MKIVKLLLYHSISHKRVQTCAKVTIECEFEVICGLSNGVISSDS